MISKRRFGPYSFRFQAEKAVAQETPFHGFIQDCGASEAAELASAIEAADIIAKGCLIDAGLNVKHGKRIRRIIRRRKVVFSCSDRDGRFKAVTTHGEGDARIRVVSWPPREFYAKSDDEYLLTAFHELLHAVDPPGRLALSLETHNTGVFADAVYGCQIACQGSLRSTSPGYSRGKVGGLYKRLFNIFEALREKTSYELSQSDQTLAQTLDDSGIIAECLE